MTKAAKLFKVELLYSFLLERTTKAFLIELWIVTRFRYGSNIHNLLYVECFQ